MLFYIAVVCCMLGMTRAQTKHCCMPVQWESQNSFIEGVKRSDTNTTTLIQGFEILSVDGNSQMINSVSSINAGGKLTSMRIIQDFHGKTQYTIIERTNCTKATLPAWTPRCIPDDSKLLLTTYYGSGKNVINTDIYMSIQGNNTIYSTIAKDDCTPLFISGSGAQGPVNALSEKTYSNFTFGIKDPTVFNIPDICKTASYTGHEDGSKFGGLY